MYKYKGYGLGVSTRGHKGHELGKGTRGVLTGGGYDCYLSLVAMLGAILGTVMVCVLQLKCHGPTCRGLMSSLS